MSDTYGYQTYYIGESLCAKTPLGRAERAERDLAHLAHLARLPPSLSYSTRVTPVLGSAYTGLCLTVTTY